MKASLRTPRGAVSLFALILALAGLFLVARSWTVVGTVLTPREFRAQGIGSGTSALVKLAEERDQGLAAVEAPERDPFSEVAKPKPKPRPRRKTTRPKPPPPPPPPVVKLIHFDEIRPVVVLEVEGRQSGRLTVGQTFKGWAVVSISSRAVVVYRDGKTIRLTL